MNFLKELTAYWREHGTKILGVLATVVATALLIDGLIPEAQMKYWLFANALLGGATVKRGFTNTANEVGANKQAGFLRPLMLAVLLAITVPLATYLPGCTSIPVQQMSIDQRIKAAYDTHTLVTQTVDTALNTHLISSRDAEQYLVLAGNARSVLDSAWALRTSDISTAEGQLQLANDILIELQKFLISRGEK